MSGLPEQYPHPIRTEWKIMAMLKKDSPSITQEEIAKQIGVNPNTIRLWTRNPLYQSYESWYLEKEYEALDLPTKRSRAEVQEQLDEFAQEMLDRLVDIAETTHDNKLLVQIGFDALDRAGYGAAKKEAARPINLIITPELMHELRRRSVEARESETVVVGQLVEAGA